MKKFSVTVFLIFLFISASFSQGLYSKENLEKASSEDLLLYLTNAQKLKKTGGIITIAGSSTAIVGIILMASGENTAYVGYPLSFIGLGATVIGIPILATGSSRVKKVSKIWNTKHNMVLMDLVPCSLYNYQTQNIQPGMTIRISF